MIAMASAELGVPWYRHRICAAERSPIRSSQGFAIDTPHGSPLVYRRTFRRVGA
jgi:hypothetical protein